jgi:hypothetical protein
MDCSGLGEGAEFALMLRAGCSRKIRSGAEDSASVLAEAAPPEACSRANGTKTSQHPTFGSPLTICSRNNSLMVPNAVSKLTRDRSVAFRLLNPLWRTYEN